MLQLCNLASSSTEVYVDRTLDVVHCTQRSSSSGKLCMHNGTSSNRSTLTRTDLAVKAAKARWRNTQQGGLRKQSQYLYHLPRSFTLFTCIQFSHFMRPSQEDIHMNDEPSGARPPPQAQLWHSLRGLRKHVRILYCLGLLISTRH